MTNTSHYKQYVEERETRWQIGETGEEPAIKKVCELLAKSINTKVGYYRYDSSWFETLDDKKVEWIRGVPDYVINIDKYGGLYIEIKIKKEGIFRKTTTGGITRQGSEIPNYGCESFYLDIYPVLNHVRFFSQAFKIKPDSFLFFFVLAERDEIRAISIDEIEALINDGYNNAPLGIYGEGYGTLDGNGNPAKTYLIPIDATHLVGNGDLEYLNNRFVNKIMFPVDLLQQENVFEYQFPILQEFIDDEIRQEFIGNKSQRNYHYPSCRYAPLSEEKRVVFNSMQEAIDAGFEPCETCHPNKAK